MIPQFNIFLHVYLTNGKEAQLQSGKDFFSNPKGHRSWPHTDIPQAKSRQYSWHTYTTLTDTYGSRANRRRWDWSQLTDCALFTWPRVSREELMLKICCVRVYVWVSVMPTEPSETAEHIGSTGVRVVYRAPLTAEVSVLMNHKTQNDQLLAQKRTEMYTM